MINIRLAGGLGNQLFQLATGLRFAKYNPSDIRVYKRSLQKYETSRDYELEKLIDYEFGSVSTSSEFLLNYRIPKLIKHPAFVNDKNYCSSTNRLALKNQYLDGYFQYDQSWPMIQNAVLWIQNHMDKSFRKNTTTGLVVHARGGDFLKNKLSLEHELNHFDVTISRITKWPEKKVLVCSDQEHARRVRNFFLDRGVCLSYTPSCDSNWIDSFVDILNADLLIGGRSTFAWWASVLGNVQSHLPSDFKIGCHRLLRHPLEV